MVRSTRPELTRAPRYMTMVLCFWWVFFLRNRRVVRNSPRGYSTGEELRSRMRGGKVVRNL
jgi:hypothetical protein